MPLVAGLSDRANVAEACRPRPCAPAALQRNPCAWHAVRSWPERERSDPALAAGAFACGVGAVVGRHLMLLADTLAPYDAVTYLTASFRRFAVLAKAM